jgi:hypothetical protein
MKQPAMIVATSINTASDLGSRERASYFVGRPDWAHALRTYISENEAKSIVTNLPEELLEAVKEHYGLVEKGTFTNGLPGEVLAVTPNPDELLAAQILVKVEEELKDGSLGSEQFATIKNEVLKPSEPEEVDIYSMNITQLRQVASQLEIKGYTKYTKDELIKKIEEATDVQ